MQSPFVEESICEFIESTVLVRARYMHVHDMHMYTCTLPSELRVMNSTGARLHDASAQHWLRAFSCWRA